MKGRKNIIFYILSTILLAADFQRGKQTQASGCEQIQGQLQRVSDQKRGGKEYGNGGYGQSRVMGQTLRAVADGFLYVEKSQTDHGGKQNQRGADAGKGGMFRKT